MSHQLPSPLPRLDRNLLKHMRKLVPLPDREEWVHTWRAELWCMRHGRPNARLRFTADLFVGLTMDALWLRTESWRRALRGTPALCLSVLLGFCAFSACVALLLDGGWKVSCSHLVQQALRCLLAAPLVVFVTTATASSRHIEHSAASRHYRRVRQLFFAAKTSLVLLLTFLLSADLCRPMYFALPATAELLQVFFFVIFTIFGLRWSFHDQEGRCKQCLCSLTTPERVGRPSHNLLEWSGTEQICRQGHGMLSVPEMQTSWCQYSQWFEHERAGYDQPVSA